MKIKFIYEEINVESNDFLQASSDFYYDEGMKKYNKRFTGQIAFTKGNSITQFLESNSNELFTIEFYSNEDLKLDEFDNAKLFTINKDIINDYCRIELREQII